MTLHFFSPTMSVPDRLIATAKSEHRRQPRRRIIVGGSLFLSCAGPCACLVPYLVPHGNGARYRESLVMDGLFALLCCGDISFSEGVAR